MAREGRELGWFLRTARSPATFQEIILNAFKCWERGGRERLMGVDFGVCG